MQAAGLNPSNAAADGSSDIAPRPFSKEPERFKCRGHRCAVGRRPSTPPPHLTPQRDHGGRRREPVLHAKRSAAQPAATEAFARPIGQISRDPDQARAHQRRRSADLQRTHKSQISIGPALDHAGSFFGDLSYACAGPNHFITADCRFGEWERSRQKFASALPSGGVLAPCLHSLPIGP
jgi:hypothetical protein